jgi:SAM-dependent methyltransferase
MEDSRGQVVRRAADVYERFFVPALFGEWAPRVAEAATIGPGQSVLDVACGTGILTREAARRAGAGGVVGLDCNDGMLSVARALESTIHWRRGRAEELPFEDGRFDAVVCQFGLMFFEDREEALREMWRVLRPGGRLAIAVWGRLESSPGYASMVALLERLFGASIADELRAPFRLGDAATLRGQLRAAGLAEPLVDTVVGQARFPSLADWVQTDIKGWTLADRIDDAQLALLVREAEVALRSFVDGDGRVAFDSPAHIVTARRPSGA